MEAPKPLYAVGKCLIPLTIEMLRKRFIVDGQFRPIEYFSPQCSCDRLRISAISYKDGVPTVTLQEEYESVPDYYIDAEGNTEMSIYEGMGPEYFIPNGTLCEGLPGNNDHQNHLNWLQSDAPGPYEPGQTRPFFWLEGVDENGSESSMQVAAGPLNVVTQSAINAVWCWVLE